MKPERYFVVVDADGVIVHTTISLTREDAIEEWLSTESSMNWLANLGRGARGQQRKCADSWEAFEARGYTVIPVSIVPEHQHANPV